MTKIMGVDKEKTIAFFKRKDIQIWITLILFLIVLIGSTIIRVSNLPNLVDQTTNDYALADLDAQYFYRIANTMVQNNLSYPAFDAMRSPGLHIEWLRELLPKFIVLVYEVVHPFKTDFSVLHAAVFSPVILYVLSLILFFALVYVLTKSKLTSIISTALLAYSPAFLMRSVAGFADHDIMGMAAIFACFIVGAISLRNIERGWGRNVGFGALLGFMVALVMASWGGGITFAITVIPFAFFINYLLNSENKLKNISFYVVFIVSSIVSSKLLGSTFFDMVNRFEGSYGILVPFVFLFLIIDYGFDKLPVNWQENKYLNKKYEKLYAIILTILIGAIALLFVGKNIFGVVLEVWFKLLFPFGGGSRLGSTVAENAQPYLNDWIAQMGKGIFYLFLLGSAFLGFEIGKNKDKKGRLLISFGWAYLVLTILFSRISSSSIFNGENFVSRAFYLSGLLVFFGIFIKQFSNGKFSASSEKILLLAITFFVIINGRSAVRIFLLITPFALILAAESIREIFGFSRETKDKSLKIFLVGLAIFLLFVAGLGFYQYRQSSSVNAKYIGASTNYQWQNAMQWVRNNTAQDAIFVHWWDYGYWIQTIGHRPTVTDGGHSGGDNADQNIGRYVLTTPNPKTALSYMKTWNVSYLLIDPTDIGKYSAFSKIGSSEKYDRFSMIPSGVIDDKQTLESKNGTSLVYQIGSIVDEDIIYNSGATQVLIPGPTYDEFGRPSYKAYIAGVVVEIMGSGQNASMKQPIAVFLYNNNQFRIPIRYVYLDNNLKDFGSGLNSTIMIIPKFDPDSQGRVSKVSYGAVIYLSPRVQTGLFSRLYLMGDPLKQYSSLTLAHQENDYVVNALRAQGISVPDIIYFNGIRAPLNIWSVNYPAETETHNEFLERTLLGYGYMDKYF